MNGTKCSTRTVYHRRIAHFRTASNDRWESWTNQLKRRRSQLWCTSSNLPSVDSFSFAMEPIINGRLSTWETSSPSLCLIFWIIYKSIKMFDNTLVSLEHTSTSSSRDNHFLVHPTILFLLRFFVMERRLTNKRSNQVLWCTTMSRERRSLLNPASWGTQQVSVVFYLILFLNT